MFKEISNVKKAKKNINNQIKKKKQIISSKSKPL